MKDLVITECSMLYMTPTLCTNGINTFSLYLRSNTKVANKALDKLFHPSTTGR